MSAELRKFPRVETALEITYYTQNPETLLSEKDEVPSMTHHFGTITNMSKGGVGILVDNMHALGEHLWIQGFSRSKKPLDCVIKWSESVAQQDKFNVGVQFTDSHSL